ncbi:cation diffusion facilitator family transporter [Roseofilum sp. BLCC_M154]|uniref:Cation diffusion facilitator family transporter n=1 Tax=Roseofilum acuticapitatum BLCC-M154 TaxID=3022444 RepID=A0ABT7APR9_9CYAN|nr:cation diffusion facilitator family transporter [Roseofilum acuticapitatum]MDJ1168454.1 cation diffusion facilitator family transporter [Roseofilum acuticapitatum BLCC-M154]
MLKDIRSQVRQVLLITLGLNVLALLIKVVVGWKTGSLSLLADALHSVTDSANNILGLVANQFASPEPDREHPYGHQKFDAIGALGIAAFLGLACFEIVSSSVERLTSGGDPLTVEFQDLWILLIVLGINIFVAFYERGVGQRIGSGILVADAKHTMSDIWVTIMVLGGLLGVMLGYPLLDVVLAFPVAILVFYSGWEVIKDNLPWLVDEMAIAPEAIHNTVMEVPGVINCHDIASRGVVGRQVFIEMHLIVDAIDVATSHEITEAVEDHLERKYHPVRVLIHVEPPDYQSDQITFQP